MIQKSDVTGLILAGGQAKRMGGLDKGLIKLNGRPLIAYVIAAMRDQNQSILISANRHLDQYSEFGYPIIRDRISDHPGPLAGILTALELIDTAYLWCVPCDSPWLTHNLLSRLMQGLQEANAEISCAHDGEHLHPVFALIKKDLQPALTDYLNRGERAVYRWFSQRRLALVDFSDTPDLFININTPDELRQAESRMQQ